MKISLIDLDKEIENSFLKSSLGKKTEILSGLLVDSPTQYSEFPKFDFTHLHMKIRKRQDFQRAAILSWYFPKNVRILFQLDLKDLWDRQDPYYPDKEVLLSSKKFCLAWIISESGWSESTLFGNILNKRLVQRISDSIFFKRMTSRTKFRKYTGYCRGYHESHHRGPSPLPVELQVGVLSRTEVENKRREYHLNVDLLTQRLEIFLSQEVS